MISLIYLERGSAYLVKKEVTFLQAALQKTKTMKDYTTKWTREELKIYMLIYCANANFTESQDEIDFIKSKIQSSDFSKLHKEFDKDNDYISIEKIKSTVERFGYTKDETDVLIKEMKSLFASDDEIDTLEENMFLGLKHILA